MSSSVGNSPDRMGVQSLYSLRWNNHQAHMQRFVQQLQHEEILVDVTLISAESSIKAHKVVLSACSPFFQRIFAENPCKHPLIVLKDFSTHQLSTLIDFMYGGEVKISQEELPDLMRAAECLQVRGLSSSEPRLVSEEPRPSSSSSTLLEFTAPEDGRHDTPEEDDNALENTREIKPALFQQTRDHPTKPLIGHMNFGIRESCGSPLMPRRKQARPRRRSGELLPQDLSRRSTPPASLSPLPSVLNLSGNQYPQQQIINRNDQQQIINIQQNLQQQHQQQQQQQQQQHHQEDRAENLSMKRSLSPSLDQPRVQVIKTEDSEATSSPRGSPLAGTSLLHPDASIQDIPAAVAAAVATVIPSMSLTQTQQSPEYLTSFGHLATSQWLSGQSPLPPPPPQSHHPREDSPHGSSRSHSYQQQQQQESSIVSRRNAMAMFTPLDGVNVALGSGFFSHATYDRTVLGDSFIAENFKPETLQGLFGTPNLGPPPAKKSKKHRNDSDGTPRRWNDHNSRALAVNRPKGQHSAPRGGPPRSWTNNELTLALQHVWEKKLTTSQASRLFGIPYNSLLMYVRGKYGKSLKLEQLRRNCTGARTPEIINNNNIKPVQQPAQISHALSLSLQHPGDNSGFVSHRSPLIGGNMTQPQGFYSADYTYPLPVNMVQLLPSSEQNSSANSSGDGCLGGGDGNGGGDMTNSQTSETPSPIVDHHHHHHQESSSSSSMQPTQPTQSAPALLQQNGSD